MMFLKESKVQRGKRVQRESFFQKKKKKLIKGRGFLFNFIVILGHASKSPDYIIYLFKPKYNFLTQFPRNQRYYN